MNQIQLFIFFFTLFPFFNLNAADFNWQSCSPEIANFCKDEKNDEKIWACLQAHDEILTTECENTHAEYEKQTGKND